MKKLLIIIVMSFLISLPVLAQSPFENSQIGLESTGESAYGSTAKTDLPQLIGSIIQVMLQIFSAILLIFIIYGGFLYMTAGGDTKKLDEAKSWIKNGIIGFIICLLAYFLTTFVVSQISATTATSPYDML